ncbi:MAG: HNH endonuclease [Paludibacteraceae bacterium]|nr:HNH endonuclease [Paludibacteraceae bacterium]
MEEWKDIKGYEGLYQVSDLGNVRSVDRTVECGSRWGGTRFLRFKGQFLKQFVGANGYWKVTLSKNSVQTTKDVHRIEWIAFNGEILGDLQVNHIDEDRLNNRLSNLNLLSPEENSNWGRHNNKISKSKSKTVYQYDLDGNLINKYPSTISAAIENGFDQATISAVARGKKSCKTYKGYKWSYEPL